MIPTDDIFTIVAAVVLVIAGVLLGAFYAARSHAKLHQAVSDGLSDMQLRLHEKIGSSSETFSQAVQQSLQSGRIEQHNVLSNTVQTLESKFNELQRQVDHKLSQTVEANRQDLSLVGERLSALHQATGQIVGSVDLPAGAIGTPMTYMVEGRQYIALTIGGGPRLVAFALPD